MAANPLSRLFKSSPNEPRTAFQVVAHLSAVEPQSRETLEEHAEAALAILTEHAADVALGPVVGCDFTDDAVEIEFTVEAASTEELHRKIGAALRVLETEGPFRYHDSTASRLPERDDEREPVPA